MTRSLSIAVRSGNVELVRLLLDRGAMMACVSEKMCMSILGRIYRVIIDLI